MEIIKTLINHVDIEGGDGGLTNVRVTTLPYLVKWSTKMGAKNVQKSALRERGRGVS